jgi:hypothetical protein
MPDKVVFDLLEEVVFVHCDLETAKQRNRDRGMITSRPTIQIHTMPGGCSRLWAARDETKSADCAFAHVFSLFLAGPLGPKVSATRTGGSERRGSSRKAATMWLGRHLTGWATPVIGS